MYVYNSEYIECGFALFVMCGRKLQVKNIFTYSCITQAQRMNEAADCDIPELEKDETFNAEDG